MQYSLILEGKVKPAVRMTQKSKWVDERAIEYLGNREGLQYQIREHMRNWELPMLPTSTPFWARIEITTTNGLHKCDIDNLAKALIDAAQGLVYQNDCWLDQLTVTRRLGDADLTIFTVGTI